MEKEALILRARAELAKLAAIYSDSEVERVALAEQARDYDAQVRKIEDALDGWPVY